MLRNLSVPCAVLCLIALFAPLAARAQPAPALPPDILQASKRHYQSGASFYQEGKYAEALVEFQAAYRLSRLPDLLYNLGRVSEKLGQIPEAADYFERYLKEKPDASDRLEIEAEVARLRQLAPPPPPEPPKVEAPPPPPPPPPPRRRLPPWPALGLLGGGAAFLVVGIATGGAAVAAVRQVETGERFNASLDSRGRSLQGAAIFFDVLGGLALAGGATWTVLWHLRQPKAPKEHEALRLAPAGLGLALTGSF